ncbi:MAG: choline dehydrogenase [Gammaproteobacteria bacterium]|nr:choline dehydrogenase [Gammaproteobacteria bacterium]
MKLKKSYDYVIVGAGTAGCILAARLAQAGNASILLLEAGSSDNHWTVRMPGGLRAHYDLKSRKNWHFYTIPQKHLNDRPVYQPRGKVLGGSASINGMVFLRGHHLDYERWQAEGAHGWSYDDVLPYFKRLESFESGADAYRGDSGPVVVRRQHQLSELDQAFLRAGEQAGFPWTDDVNGAQQEGFCRFDMNIDNGVRASTAYAYLHKNTSNKPTVLTNTLALRIIIKNNQALGIEFQHRNQTRQVFANAEVILSAGAYGSPQLLMISGIGPANHLNQTGIKVLHDLPGVGENLQDHLEVHIQQRCKLPISLNRYLRPDRMLRVGVEWFLFKTGVVARNQANTGAFLRSDESQPHPNIQFHFFPVFFDGWTPRHDTSGYLLDTGPMRPTSRGKVRLNSSDPAQPLAIDPDFMATEHDREQMIEGFEMGRETLSQQAFREYDAGEVLPGAEVKTRGQIENYIRDHAGSAYHPCGTCRMHADDTSDSVVDCAGKLKGIDNLRVIDASIIPSIPSSNINAVVMMIAEKLSDNILGKAP